VARAPRTAACFSGSVRESLMLYNRQVLRVLLTDVHEHKPSSTLPTHKKPAGHTSFQSVKNRDSRRVLAWRKGVGATSLNRNGKCCWGGKGAGEARAGEVGEGYEQTTQ